MAPSRALSALRLLTLGAALSCSADEAADGLAVTAPDPGGPTGGAPEASAAEPPATGEYGGTYFVPVPPELDAYAHFELAEIRVRRDSRELRLSYDLPALLLGESRRISFRGVQEDDGSYLLQGEDGTALCQPLTAGLRCEETLRVEPDPRKLDQLLEPLPAPEAAARRAVTERFAIDPIGVLNVDSDG